MISLKEMPARAEGLLTRASPRIDGSGEIIWDVDVSFGCDSNEAATVVDGFVPGSLQTWNAGANGSKSSVKSVGGYDLVRVQFSNQEQSRIATGHADIRYCSFTVSGDIAMLTIRFRVHGLLQEAAASLVYKLDQIIGIEIDSQQMTMFKPSVASDIVEEAGISVDLLGQLIIFEANSTVISGILSSVSDGSGMLAGGQEVSFEKRKAKLISNFLIEPIDGMHIPESIKEYTDISNGNGSWDDFVQAFGELFAEGGVATTAGGGWPLSEIVVARAISIFAENEAGGIDVH